jgi:hypothetical protein
LHPQSNETAWNDQVLKESRAEQFGAVQWTMHDPRLNLPTVWTQGTEGAGYDDVGLKLTSIKD